MFLHDPDLDKKSVSLTLLVVSFVILAVLGIFQSVGEIQTTGPFMELFIVCTSLYFGRKLDLSSIINRKGKK